MTPKEKAEELVTDLMFKNSIVDNNGEPKNISITREQAIRVAIILCDEISTIGLCEWCVEDMYINYKLVKIELKKLLKTLNYSLT